MTSLLFKVRCNGYYYTELEVPDGSTKEEAWAYIKENYHKADIGGIELFSCNLEDEDYEYAKLLTDKGLQRSVL